MNNEQMTNSLNGESQHETRRQMEHFWSDHSKDGTLEEMMLDTQAKTLSIQEQPEILSLLPSVKGMKVLELGAGIGRFTGVLAEEADYVTAVDFMEKFIDKNKETHGNKNNVEFIHADVTALDFPPESFDVIFSNWLMMYLTDEEVIQLAAKTLSWLTKDGFLFFRESCFYQSGNKKRDFNPTVYRNPAYYNAVFQGTVTGEHNADNAGAGFELIFSRSVQCYIKLKNNQNQFCWLMQKTRLDMDANHGFQTFQKFLDNQQYTRDGILRYEKIFGDGYVSTGGARTTEGFVAMLDLKPGLRVLDVGAGIGGGDFYMAETWLKPGGKLLISDYCCGDLPHTETFKMYVAQRGYTLCTPEQYGKLLEEAGFVSVNAEDRTWQFIEALEGEKTRVENNKEEFMKDFSEDDFKYLIDGWTNKLIRTKAGDQKWGLFLAKKNKAKET
ncbi:phosphoethanolamine N-methyltransferase-like isoform X2 [Asterias rubens]|uniref:phosphoethanolamine N-methyltransferase-like isoform X2 n=1 Tax=Asterias rubens TaxID=7604 RepID=UPI0014557059|nr:phosphoethanolamine N-methyltransferase-like isoform X2 [Asterias rubens]